MDVRFPVRLSGLIAVLLLASCGDSSIDTTLLQSAVSPDSAYVARVYVRSGGGAAGWVALFVNVDPRAAPFRPRRAWVKEHVMVMGPPYLARVTWTGPRDLRVEYPPDGHFGDSSTRLPRKGDVSITYAPTYREDSSAVRAPAPAP